MIKFLNFHISRALNNPKHEEMLKLFWEIPLSNRDYEVYTLLCDQYGIESVSEETFNF